MKEWIRYSRSANGANVVTCTQQDGNLTVKYATKAYRTIKDGVSDARTGATRAMNELKEATA